MKSEKILILYRDGNYKWKKLKKLTKDDMNNYSTTTQMNSAIEQKANEITNTVSETYAKKEDVTSITDNIGDYMINISKSTILLTSDLDGNITN